MLNLREFRKKAKMTQGDIAKACGITQCSYSYYEIGKRNPKPDMLRKFAQIFGCTVDELIGEDDDRIREA